MNLSTAIRSQEPLSQGVRAKIAEEAGRATSQVQIEPIGSVDTSLTDVYHMADADQKIDLGRCVSQKSRLLRLLYCDVCTTDLQLGDIL